MGEAPSARRVRFRRLRTSCCPSCRLHEQRRLVHLADACAARGGRVVRVLPEAHNGHALDVHWHRKDESLLELRCAEGHAFAGALDVLAQDGWCPVCEDEELRQPMASRKRPRPASLSAEAVRSELAAPRDSLYSQKDWHGRTDSLLTRLRGLDETLPAVDLERLEVELKAALERIKSSALRTLRKRVRSAVDGVASVVRCVNRAMWDIIPGRE